MIATTQAMLDIVAPQEAYSKCKAARSNLTPKDAIKICQSED